MIGMSRHARGDGTLASARTHADVAILVFRESDEADLGRNHAVYTIVCRNNHTDANTLLARAMHSRGDLPDRHITRLLEAESAPIIYYVGQSKDVVRRLYTHISSSGGLLTELFPPVRLVSVEWFDTEQEARTAEQERAVELDESQPGAYVGGGR